MKPRISTQIIGRRFGFLTVLSEAVARGLKSCVICRCDCGIEKSVRSRNLVSGNTKSCGCKVRALVSAANKGRARIP